MRDGAHQKFATLEEFPFPSLRLLLPPLTTVMLESVQQHFVPFQLCLWMKCWGQSCVDHPKLQSETCPVLSHDRRSTPLRPARTGLVRS